MRIDRLNSMEQYILGKGSVSLEELTETFTVSLSTLRRDIDKLLDKGNIRKVYGGVCAVENQMVLQPLAVRNVENHQAKQVIGKRAAALVPDGASVFLDSGSTTVNIIAHLAERENITLITHSLSVLYEASKYPSINVFALGGLYHSATSSYVGMSTISGINDMHFDMVFLSATGVSLDNGLSNITYLETEIKKAVVSQNEGNNIILLADQSKFGKRALFTYCRLEELSAVVTDLRPADAFLQRFEQYGVRCIYDE